MCFSIIFVLEYYSRSICLISCYMITSCSIFVKNVFLLPTIFIFELRRLPCPIFFLDWVQKGGSFLIFRKQRVANNKDLKYHMYTQYMFQIVRFSSLSTNQLNERSLHNKTLLMHFWHIFSNSRQNNLRTNKNVIFVCLHNFLVYLMFSETIQMFMLWISNLLLTNCIKTLSIITKYVTLEMYFHSAEEIEQKMS